MRRWKELPASLDERVRQLVVQLRRFKDRGGFSLSALAAKTSYSRSSWERYLNGRQLPPRQAVEQLARVCAVDPDRLLVLWELAAAAWPEQPEGEGEDGGESEDEGDRDRRALRRQATWIKALAGSVAVLVIALAVLLLVVRPWQSETTGAAGRAPGDAGSPFVFVPGRAYPCRVTHQDGELRAGYSGTRTVLMELKSTGWEVLEAQCLLRHHGYDPGVADGDYGPRSQDAARRFQHDRGLVVDGIVGPDTWKELRR
ncbi:helix-turn-helix domain-containing protein [Streptomyces sp. NPDC052396]|uniref:helix-turn-helix domain-containing protein n=1 Tax=Streptomyces sp. NPDC052396 TaxID=3365689 RepID=UPI0037CE9BF9